MGMTVDANWLVEFFRGQARLGFEEGDYTRTYNSCTRVLQHDPDDREALLLLGEASLASHYSGSAAKCFGYLVDLEPGNLDHLLNLAKAHVQLQDWPAAVATYSQVLQIQPQHPEASHALKLILDLQQRIQKLQVDPAAQPGRNDPCPCGSDLKYKKCCLARNTDQALQNRLLQAFGESDWRQVIALASDIPNPPFEVKRATALALYYSGQRAPAYPFLKALSVRERDDLELLAALADVMLDKDLPGALSLARTVLARDHKQSRAHLVLVACHAREGRTEEAERELRRLLEVSPECSAGWERLYNFLNAARRPLDAWLAMCEWTERCPQNSQAWLHRGKAALLQQGEPDEIRQSLEHALTLDPDHHEALCWLGQWYQNRQDPKAALGWMLKGIQVKPDYQQGWNMLGGLYHSVGRQHEAEGCFMRALAITPEQPEAWNNLANTYLDAQLLDEAERVMRVGLSLNQQEPNLWNNLGNILNAGKRLYEAREAYERVLKLDPSFKPVLINLAGIEASFGNLGRAIELLHGVLDLPQARTNALFFANYHPDWSGEQVLGLYREVIERYYPKRLYFEYENVRSLDRRLRIGYVSPDFRHHVCAQFIGPLLKSHDHDKVEVFAYSLVRREDLVTERFIGYADHWRHCVGLSNQAIAEQIRADGIDILVDLAGHTGNNGLGVFALKPAPVQVSWWVGYAFGTGIEAIDYFLADEQMLPHGCERSFAEQLWRMPAPAMVYQPNVTMPDVTPLPALKNGYVTFGSLTRPVRINHRVVRVWASLLKRVPDAHLILDSGSFDDQTLCDRYLTMFAEHGIAKERLHFGYTSPVWDVLAKMDIALDCFPHNSGTTLYESLWMGLPFVTLRDRPSMGRVGALILNGLGRPEWCADSEEQYVDKLAALAADIEGLASIRQSLREHMRTSLLCNAEDFAKRMEQTYRDMWKRYCEEGSRA